MDGLTFTEQNLLRDFISYCKKYKTDGVSQKNLPEMETATEFYLRGAIFDNLFEKGYLKRTNNLDGRYWKIAPAATEIVLTLFNSNKNFAPEDNSLVPAADRFVRINGNAPHIAKAAEQAANALEELADTIKENNEFSVTGDDRLVVVREIDTLKLALRSPVVRVQAIWAAIQENSTLSWLLKEASSGVIRTAAGNVWTAFAKLLSILPL